MLLYVSVTVPLRAGFQLDVDLWSASFWVDVIVDVFFVLDMFLNFRTAYYDRAGLREDRAGRMARNYLSGWFVIDLFSCLPLGYLLRLIRLCATQTQSGNITL